MCMDSCTNTIECVQCVVVKYMYSSVLLDVYSDCYRECKSWSELDTCSDKLQFLTATSSSTSEAEEGQLRQRAGKQQTQSSVQEVKPQPKVTAGNPIRWFSCLPPQSLRQSQSQFIEGKDLLRHSMYGRSTNKKKLSIIITHINLSFI